MVSLHATTRCLNAYALPGLASLGYAEQMGRAANEQFIVDDRRSSVHALAHRVSRHYFEVIGVFDDHYGAAAIGQNNFATCRYGRSIGIVDPGTRTAV